jgi:Fe-S cluster biogenesis protein NfuA
MIGPMKLEREQVEAVIHERLDPLFALDGGAVEVERVDPVEGLVRVRFTGSYQACPSREVLLSRVVEPTLKHELPAVKSVKMG